MLITEGKMKEALEMVDEILVFEPKNKMIKEYKKILMSYIEEGILSLSFY